MYSRQILEREFLLLTMLWLATMSPPVAGAQSQITFWTTEVEKDRLEIQRDIARTFTRKTGIGVRVIPVQENLLTERVTAAYAARSLPDVLFHPVEFTIGWAEAGILDDRSATEVVNHLGKETFGAGPLNLARVPGGYAAVPIDGWGQLLLYRKDLFEKRGLPVPNRWDCILQAAKALHNPPLMWGLEVATDPGETYTQQVFEHFALSNGVRLTGKSGIVDLDTVEMVETLKFYKALTRFSPPGNLYWLHTRMDYISGRAAMIIWSPFILDELSGLRRDQPVVPDIAKRESGFLARNTGFVTIICGPKGAAQYGQINYLGITRDADNGSAKQWVEFLLNGGYLRWLGMAAEGKLPVRKGTRDAPNCFINAWKELEFGVTTRAKISEFYGLDVVKTIAAVAFTWSFILDPQLGVLNWLAVDRGLLAQPVPFLSQRWCDLDLLGVKVRLPLALTSVILFEGWRYFPFGFLFILARLQAIPDELYQAASVDGASPFQRFYHITLPQLATVLSTLLLFRFIWTFNKFDDIFLLTRGQAGTKVLTIKVYDYAFGEFNIGASSAMAMVLFGVLSVFLLIYFRWIAKEA